MNAFEIGLIVALVLVNGVFAAYEMALASVKSARLRALVEARRAGARAALAMKERMEASLAVVQLGVTFFGAVAAAVGGASVSETIAPWLMQHFDLSFAMAHVVGIALFVVPLSAASIIVGELIPKAIGLRHPDRVCLELSPLMRLFGGVAYPLVWACEWLTKRAISLADRVVPPAPPDIQTGLNELRAQIGMLRTAKAIGVQQEQIMVQAARLSAVRIRDIQLPTRDIVMLHADAPLTVNLLVAHMDLHTRFPVTEIPGDPQSIIGYATFKEMMFLAKAHPENPSLREITRPIIRLNADLQASEALRRMVGEHVHLALVVDPASKQVTGLITQEDIFEELVGDIQDEFDRLPRHLTPLGRQWIAGGAASLGKLREALGLPHLGPGLAPEATINDWIGRALNRHPRGGDALQLDGVSLLVRKVRRFKVTEVLIDPSGSPIQPTDG